MGMEPVSQPMPVLPSESPPPSSRAQSDQLVTLLAASQHAGSSPPAGVQFSPRQPPSHPSIVAAGQQQQQQHQPVFGASPMGLLPAAAGGRPAVQQQGPDQLSGQLAHLTGEKKPPLLNHKLSGAEMTAVRQLITGYRESAAFLLRSADELEHLLQIQPKL